MSMCIILMAVPVESEDDQTNTNFCCSVVLKNELNETVWKLVKYMVKINKQSWQYSSLGMVFGPYINPLLHIITLDDCFEIVFT
jgi:hypothetical protein